MKPKVTTLTQTDQVAIGHIVLYSVQVMDRETVAVFRVVRVPTYLAPPSCLLFNSSRYLLPIGRILPYIHRHRPSFSTQVPVIAAGVQPEDISDKSTKAVHFYSAFDSAT